MDKISATSSVSRSLKESGWLSSTVSSEFKSRAGTSVKGIKRVESFRSKTVSTQVPSKLEGSKEITLFPLEEEEEEEGRQKEEEEEEEDEDYEGNDIETEYPFEIELADDESPKVSRKVKSSPTTPLSKSAFVSFNSKEEEEITSISKSIVQYPVSSSPMWKKSVSSRVIPTRSLTSIKLNVGLARSADQLPKTQPIQVSPPNNFISPLTSPTDDSPILARKLDADSKSLGDELKELLSDPRKVRIFKRFLDKEFCSEALMFWIDTTELVRRADKMSKLDWARSALATYEKYFGEDSDLQVNLDVDIQKRIEDALLDPPFNIFKEAQYRIFELLKTDSFRKFKKSPYYKQLDKPELFDTEMNQEKDNKKTAQELNYAVGRIYEGEDIRDICELSVKLARSIVNLFRRHLSVHHYNSIIEESDDAIYKTKALDVIKDDPEYEAFVKDTALLQKARIPKTMHHREKIAFFINLYNTMSLHGILETDPPPITTSQKLEFYKKIRYRIGNDSFSLFEIEHGILRAPMTKPTFLGLRLRIPKYTKQDPRYSFVLSHPEPLINFALWSTNKSSPRIDVYTPMNVTQQLMSAALDYLSREVELEGFDSYHSKQRLKLPKILYWYSKDFGPTEKDMLLHIMNYFPPEIKSKVRFFMANLKIKFKEYDWSYSGYMISPKFDANAAVI